jgi:hypothetical protein
MVLALARSLPEHKGHRLPVPLSREGPRPPVKRAMASTTCTATRPVGWAGWKRVESEHSHSLPALLAAAAPSDRCTPPPVCCRRKRKNYLWYRSHDRSWDSIYSSHFLRGRDGSRALPKFQKRETNTPHGLTPAGADISCRHAARPDCKHVICLVIDNAVAARERVGLSSISSLGGGHWGPMHLGQRK